MAQPARAPASYAQYLAAERSRELKHEYLDGLERAMGGGTIEHGRLAAALAGLLRAALADRPCNVYSSDVRIRVAASNRSFYPDLSVVCGRLARAEDDEDAITNPVVIVEVLSDSSEAYDRGEKFRHYRRLDSLREYVLVSQAQPLVEVWRREGSAWAVADHGPGDEIRLASLDVAIGLDAVYRDPLA